MKNSQILALILLSTASHWVDASNQQPAELYKIEHKNWYGTCSPKRCPNPFDDLIFQDNDQIQLHGGSFGEFINHRKNDGDTLLIKTIQANNVQNVKRLIEIGADIDQQDNWNGATPLHIAAQGNSCQITQLLLANGAHVNQQNIFDETPLHWAVKSNAYETAQLLINANVDVNQQNNLNGFTPLHIAAENRLYQITQLLLAAGADVNQQNKSGHSSLHCAVYSNAYKITPLLLAANADVNKLDKAGNTPLHFAVRDSNNRIILLLLAARASATIKNNHKKAPRELADNQVTRAIFDLVDINRINNYCSIS